MGLIYKRGNYAINYNGMEWEQIERNEMKGSRGVVMRREEEYGGESPRGSGELILMERTRYPFVFLEGMPPLLLLYYFLCPFIVSTKSV